MSEVKTDAEIAAEYEVKITPAEVIIEAIRQATVIFKKKYPEFDCEAKVGTLGLAETTYNDSVTPEVCKEFIELRNEIMWKAGE